MPLDVSIAGISKSYGQGLHKTPVLRDVNVKVSAGQSLAITGPSGSGKSTLLSLISGLDVPDSGTITIGDTNIFNLSETHMLAWRARNLGIVFQNFLLLPYLTSLENVSLPLEIFGDKNATAKAEKALELVGLAHRKTHLPSQLSGGECQRVAIARAFVTNPGMLVADEPSGNLDEKTGFSVMQLLFDLVKNQKTTLILVTHNQKLADLCDLRFVLDGGTLTRQNVQP
ncbi:MAG: ABC transporter ATP-binding protein [Oligoflexales bacterium]